VTLLARVAAELERAGIATAVCGAGALAVHGIARSTYDIDLLTTDPHTLRDATWRTLAGTQALRGRAAGPLGYRAAVGARQ
jgi:hypothetical protein